MDVEVLGYDEMVLIAAPKMVPASGRVTIEELAQLPFIEAPSGIVRRNFVDRQLSKLGVEQRNVVLQLGHTEAMKRAAREGFGVSLVFRSAIEDELEMGTLKEIAIDGAVLRNPVFLVSRKGKTFSPLHTGLIEAIRDTLSDV